MNKLTIFLLTSTFIFVGCSGGGGGSSVPLGFVSLSENLFMIAGALIMLFL